MNNVNKVSQSIAAPAPDFIGSEYPLLVKFVEYYYRSQEKTGLGQNIINNFLEYLDIDKLDVSILDGATKLVEPINNTSDTIVVESVDKFLDKNGTILIGDEIIYYESTTSSPNIALSPGISYEQVKVKWTTLESLIDSFDGTTRTFQLLSLGNPVTPPESQFLIVSLYGDILYPGVDYQVSGTTITFTTAPRTRTPSDSNDQTYILFQKGFIENSIVAVDDISGSFGEGKKTFKLTRNGDPYEPITDEFVVAIYDNDLLAPRQQFYIDGDLFIFEEAPLKGKILSLYSIEAPIPSFGTGALGYARINNAGELTSISNSETGSGYRFEYPPKVTISSAEGSGGSATALINGVKTISLLDGGFGYSDTNPPIVEIETPTKEGSLVAGITAEVTNGSVSGLTITSSGSGYTFNPRVTFKQPGGAKLAPVTIADGQISGAITITNGGAGYTTAPVVYVDEPTGSNPIKASFRAVLTSGVVTSIEILNRGQGYTEVPRIAIVDPTGAQVLQTRVDGDGRVIAIDLLSGGSGYDDVPSVYIVDNRVNGGSGAKAVASIFNGQITDINITNFGSGYSAAEPPTIFIQNPPTAKASVTIGLNEVTGYRLNKSGSGYSKSQFLNCARAASGIVKYTEDGNAVFSNNTMAMPAEVDTEIKCLDSLFIKRLLDKYTEQFLPDVPELDYKSIDVRTAIKTVRDFYQSKGTSFSISYLFKLLYGENISVSYPKDQIIKPSASTWSIDTVLRATLVSGDPRNIRDGVLTQDPDIADPNIQAAQALVENYIAINTSTFTIYELVLSEETISGTFTVPYKTKLAEPLSAEDTIITVDSTVGWPERNGQFQIGNSEIIQYKEKSLNQFIECTRGEDNTTAQIWDAATEVTSNFRVFINKGTATEVELSVLGIVDAEQTTLTDTGSYYLPGDKLSISKLGGTSTSSELTTWLYNVKKLIQVESIAFNNNIATVTCSNPHGVLVGDQVTIYGANPIIYNGTFLVTSRDSENIFQYQLPQPAVIAPQGNILVSVDLNKGKSDNSAVLNAVGPYTTNVQNTFFNDNYVYVASTGIPNYKIGPFPGSALLPGNQRKLNRFPRVSSTISTKDVITPGPIGTWINGVSIWSYKSNISKTFGALTSISINNAGQGYDAAFPPSVTVVGGGGAGALASVQVNGSIDSIDVTAGGSGYTDSPLVSIVGGGGSGASATAIITKGVVSRVLINNGGTGYTSQPTITIVGGGGQGATATAAVRGPIASVSVDAGGNSYTSIPQIQITSGSGAVAQPIVSNGRIISVAIINGGSGYTTAPEVQIQGEGFGAIARATIDVDGENAGRVTGIEIVNKGIGYVQGTTLINLTSVGQDAQFTANIFQWTYNLQSTSTFDAAKGGVFEGFNNQYGGEYAHVSNPQRLRYVLGDNMTQTSSGALEEEDESLEHSPIIGWAFDGNPIYGPYAYEDPTDQSSTIRRLLTSYRLKPSLIYDENTNISPVRDDGPALSTDAAGTFVEDYEYVFNLGDLDQYNGRFCKTPEFPEGRYVYFVTIDATAEGNPVFPYVLGPSFNSIVDKWNLNADAVQQNIPTGVVRYRDPYENVDIDVERIPNASTNGLTLEDGDLLLFEVEDENRDGVIDQSETDDPDQILEESPLQLFDYFPKVREDSKVDIEVETITKFEDASVTGFAIENPGASYQVDDRLVFDNEGTDGLGVSARVSRIKGETIDAYSFENLSGVSYGKITTDVPHNLVVGDRIFVDYEPIMANTNKEYVVRQYKGIEEIVINQTGSGYNTDIPPSILIDGDGNSAELEAVVTAVGSIDKVNIINSGNSYTKNPRIILSHPQVFKKTDYFVGLLENDDYTKINDIFVTEDKKSYVCGTTKNAAGDTNIAFIAKFSANGTIEWQKTIVNSTGLDYTDYVKLYVDGNEIWVAGQTKPNDSVVDAYNPDIMLVKYTEAANGLSATLTWQKAYAGISGNTRADHITALEKYSDTRFLIGGFTNTNSGNPYDAFIASIDTSGNFAIKRKLSSANASEKLTAMKVVGTDIYFVLETADNASTTNVNLAFGKAQLGTSAIVTSYIKQVVNSVYSFGNTSLSFDEYNEFYVAGDLTLKSNGTTRDSFWVGKFDVDGDILWNKRYVTGSTIDLAPASSIDIFNDFNIAFTKTDDTTGQKIIENVKIKYDGSFINRTSTDFNINNIEGVSVHGMATDNSGDVYLAGQTSWNRNEFIFTFNDNTATDITNHYTATVLIGSYGEESLDIEDNVAKIKADDALTGRIRAVDNIDDSYGEIVTTDTINNGVIGKVLTIDTIDNGTLGDIVTTDTINQGVIGKVLAVTGGTTDANRVAGSYNIGASDYSTNASGSGATFTIGVDVNGAITSITITSPGSGFAVSEQITVPDTNLGNGGAADLTFDVSDITDQRAAGTYTIGASDYSVSPTGGTGATFSIVVDGSGNAAITVTDGGSGYSIDDTISISDSNLGSAGAETLTFDVASVTTQRTAGTYTIGSSDYSTDGSGTGATFSVVVDGSGNCAVTVTGPGSAYVVDETFSIPDSNLGGGGASPLTFDVATRTNQRTAGTYTIGASDYSTDGSGTGATFSVVVDGSGNGTVTVTGIGSGYAVDETITIPDSNLGSGGAEAFQFDVASVSLARAAGTYSIDSTKYTTDSVSGANASFEITVASDGGTTIDIVNPGTNYLVNETFTITDANLGSSGADNLTFDVATIGNAGDWANAALKIPGTALGTKLDDDWTLEFMMYKYYAGNGSYSQTEHTLVAIGDATDATGGFWLYYDIATGKLELIVTNNTTTINAATTPLQSGLSNMFADNSWQFIGVKKTGNTFAVYVNGNVVFSGSVTNNTLANKDLYIGNIPGRNGTTGTFRSNEQGQFYADNIRLKNRSLTPTVPSDVTAYPASGQFAENYTWTDTAWFTTNLNQYDYTDYEAFSLKVDKDAAAPRLGTTSEQTNTKIGFVRTAGTLTSFDLTNTISDYTLGATGLQTLDYDDVTTTLSQDTETLTQSADLWGSRTATVPSPGSQKLRVTAVVKDRYYFKPTNTLKIDNVQKLTLNQEFNVIDNSKVVLYNTANNAFINSGYVVRSDENNIYVAINNNSWTNDLNTGYLKFEQFSEQSTYGIVGPVVNVVNEITGYTFAQVGFSPSVGTFTIDLSQFDAPDSGGTNNLDDFALFKDYSTDDYTIRIDEISGSSNFAVGSVITLSSGDISFNADKDIATITNLTGVSKITIVANLTRILQATAVANTDEVYVVTGSKHYLSKGENVFIDGNVTTGTSEYNGSFKTESIVSPIEFTYKLPAVATTSPAANGVGNVDVFVKSPTLKMYYGHNYIFDVSHSTMLNSNLSFSKDNLYKLEYSFNSIQRVGTPGAPGANAKSTVSLKVDKGIVTNISYYFDPSRTGDDSPVVVGSYLDVVDSPYKGIFDITSIEGATITTGADIFKFLLVNEPEGVGETTTASYATSSKKAVGAINNVRIVNSGGFYTRLPVVTGIVSSRNIERVQINDPGTEYAVGTYNSVPIAGDGEGGFVQITVADGQDSEGNTISGQIQAVSVTSPGTGYTTASIDIEAIEGILGPGATGSGADLDVVIPPFGTGASIFTKGDSVGKIKRLKNNNFGYDYPHDYTLRPEITFPINAQLNSTSILESITVTDPGSGYTQAPAVVITGGGGSGAIAEAVVENGRLSDIIVKDSGSGYSSEPTIELKSSFNYVINLDLGLLQFAFPHGIANGSAVTLNVVDTGDGAEFPLSAGALGRLNGTTTYYAIAGAANSLEDDQLKLAISSANAELGDAISFVNAGTGRQQVLTTAFGGVAKANVITSTFLEGELVYQGSSIENATATGFISTNNGWQVGPRIVKIVDYNGEFLVGQSITGVISKSSGVIADLKIAKGVLDIGSITKTTGQFTDDVGKPSEIVQKIQDSYYYQDFSYAVRSAVSINEWKDILIKNVHPASFKVFGELSIDDYGFIPNKETSFQITKSVELAQEAIVPNIQNFALVEPVYSEFNNTEVLFRQKRLTSSENILTSTVQTLDDISNLFDGVETAFPLTVNQQSVITNENQLMIILNGVVQTPGTAFNVIDNLLVFAEPPQPPASVRYVTITFTPKSLTDLEFNNISGIFPNIGNVLVGSTTSSRFTVTQVEGDTIRGFYNDLGSNNDGFTSQEFVTGNTTGFNANFDSSSAVENIGLFVFGETVRNFDNDQAKVEQVNLERGQETPIAQLRFGVGLSTTTFEVVARKTNPTDADAPVASGQFVVGKKYQMGPELYEIVSVTQGTEATTLEVIRGVNNTTAQSHLEDTPIYKTEISVTNTMTLSKTIGTYQSTPGLYSIQDGDTIIGLQSGVVVEVVTSQSYEDPITETDSGSFEISEGSNFFGLLFNRIASVTYPNVILDDIASSQVSILDFDDNATAYDTKFPSTEPISNNIIKYDNASGALQDDEYIRNYKFEYGNNVGDFQVSEPAFSRKLTFRNLRGEGLFKQGQVIRSDDTKAEVIGYAPADKTIYLGKVGRSKGSGEDYHHLTFNGNAQLDVDQKKFNNASLLLDGTGDYISIPTSTEFGFGTTDFTIECYIRPANVSGAKAIIDFRTTGTEVSPYLYLDGTNLKYFVNNLVVWSGNTTLAADTWYHIALVRSSGTTKVYVNGALDGASNYVDTNNYGSTKPVRIGGTIANGDYFNGHIDELRISTNARYTDAFTPQQGIFQGDANAVLLVHFDGADAATYVEDWSGTESFTAGEFFNNDAIRSTSLTRNSLVQVTQRYYDAAGLIRRNKDYVANEAVYLMKEKFPYFTVPGGEINCEDDIRDILDSIISDLENGSNSHIWDSSSLYVNRSVNPITLNHVESEITETVWVYDKVKEILEYIINNDIWDTQGDHGLEQVTDATITDSSYTTLTSITPTGATYDAVTGDMVLTKSSHGLVGPTTYTPTGATYNAATGLMTITINNHGFSNGDKIQIANNGLTFSCTMGGGSNKTYPRRNDPGSLGWLKISNVQTNTFDINIGTTLDDYYTVTAATYNPNTNRTVLTIGDHELRPGTSIRLQNESLTWTCATDNNGSEHSYPRSGDGNYETAIEILNNGSSHDVSTATYNATTGVLVLTALKGTISNSAVTTIGTGYATATNVALSGGTGSGAVISITSVGGGVGDIVDYTVTNAGTGYSKNDVLTVPGGNGDARITISQIAHGWSVGDKIRVEDNALTFTCDQDNNYTNHTYPRSTDPFSGRWLRISAVTPDTYTVNVGPGGTAVNSIHTFVSAAANAVTYRDGTITIAMPSSSNTSVHTFVRDELIGGNGAVRAGGNYAHTFVSAVTDSITKQGDAVTIADESIRFTCTSDGNDRELAHPRTSDTRASRSVLPVTAHTTNTFTVNVGASPAGLQFAHTFASVDTDAITVVDYSTADCADVYGTTSTLLDILTDTLENANLASPVDHLATVTRSEPTYEFAGGTIDAYLEVPFSVSYSDQANDIIYTNLIDTTDKYRFRDAANLLRLNTTAIIDKTSFDLLQRYPDLASSMPRNADGSGAGTERCKTDLSLIIADLIQDIEFGGNYNTIRAAKTYLGSNNELIHIQNQLQFSIYAHSRLSHYMKQAITGDLTTDNTDAIITGDWGITNDGTSTSFTPTNLTYDAATGVSVITIGTHSLKVGSYITIADNSITMTCAMDNNATQHTYPRAGDSSQGDLRIDAVTDTTITVNLGASGPNQYFTAQTGTTYDASNGTLVLNIGDHNLRVGMGVVIADNSLTFTCDQDNHQSPHTYPRSTDPASGTSRTITAVTNTTITVNVGAGGSASGSAHLFVSGTANSISHLPQVTQTFVSATANAISTSTNCADVKGAIDTLISILNDALAPTPEDFAICADRVFFNRDYIAEEITGLTTAEFTYQLNGVNFNAFVYPGSDGLTKCQRDIKLILRAINSDLQTGGNNTTLDAARLYLDANNHLNHIEEELLATLFAFEQIKVIGEFAIKNNLLAQGSAAEDLKYVAQHTTQTPVVDSEYAPNENEVVYRFRELVDIVVNLLAPAGQSARSAGKNILYNQNYYEDELESIVNSQFGSGSWTYDSFVDEITTNVVHDLITTDTTDKQTATKVVVTGASDDFTVGELVIGGTGNGYYKVLEWDEDGGILYLGPKLGGTAFTSSEVLTGRQSNATATTSSTGTTFDWYNNPGNVATRDTAETITSLIAGEVPGTNLWTNPESFLGNWSNLNTSVTVDQVVGPDGSLTADLINDNTTAGEHYRTRVYNLTSFETFDATGTTFDATDESFDTGSASALQKFTASMFVKENDLSRVKFEFLLDAGTGAGQQNAFFTFRADTGVRGSVFQPGGAIRIEQEGVKAIGNISVTTTSAMTGTYTGVTSTGAAVGTEATFDITIDHDLAPNTATITINNDGINYDIGDTLTIAAADINGANSSNDLTFDVTDIFAAGAGVIPYGDGWFRLYITGEFGFGFSTVAQRIYILNDNGQESYAGTGQGIYAWGAKLNKGELDPYVSVSGETFFSNTEYNIKQLILNSMIGWMSESLDNTLTSPSPESTTYTFYDSTAAANYNAESIRRTIRYLLEIVKTQLGNTNYVTTISDNSGITIPTYTYGARSIPTGMLGGLESTEYFYGSYTGSYAELKTKTMNEGFVVKVFKRFRIDGDITDGPYIMNEVVQKQGDSSITGVVYGFHEDENYKYLDVAVTAGTWAITDVIEGQTNTTTAQLSAIEDRLHVIDLRGTFVNDIPFKGYTSGQTATPSADILNNNASVLANTGGKLTVDTEGLTGTFETTAVVYPSTSREYLDLQSYAGLELNVGDRIGSDGHQRLQISIITANGITYNNFTEGNRIYKVVANGQVANVFGLITGVDLANNFIYVKMIQGTLALGDSIGDYGIIEGDFPVGYATISTIVDNAGAATGLIQNVQTIGAIKRVYLSDIRGTFSERDAIIGPNGHKSIILDRDILKARVKRFFKGFDGVTTNFKLSTGNGTQYLPDPEGHLLIFINGILQPPGATNAFTAFSDQIQFTEAPEPGASFTGFYVGKLRQLDDISFEFDSLRQSFNLKRNDVFYSLTLTDGVQSSTIQPENNIIVSLNGVIQQPGVGFEVVGSRIIFSEIPRVGSTFVAFSYVGSEADVDAAEVVPSIESGDLIRIQGETSDREVAIIESSNSLITFDYLGSVFGRDGSATPTLTSQFIESVRVTAGGSGYTSKPAIVASSITGSGAEITPLIGVAGIEISAVGSGYQPPIVDVETSVPDDWTAPDLSQYGEELVDPEL